ncbi:chemotaxis protein CheW [Cyanobacterium sp. Dongsha4]|uniref:chemotaxis protein CheW n=1 Tax=Cyanobacterium sp. DS4 TaxID=2878255 RepID=UPI002E7FC783|nr:chemotaxis protein CheW [Cyanobacterium sp. Dongsha4]WVL01098.1 chemotaxis protein CheW [Cyanobacterium sp. Dongsha4]
MNTANLPNQPSSGTEKVKLLVFSIGNLNTALHIDAVEKVVNYNQIFGSGLNHFGLVNLGDKEITVVDLHKKLFNSPQALSTEGKKYLLLVKNSSSETFGIVISQTPELYDIPLNVIRILPPSYRRADTLKIASHVAVFKENEGEKTIFLLDPDELINPNI